MCVRSFPTAFNSGATALKAVRQKHVLPDMLSCSCTLQDIPRLEIPLHTLIELTPKPDGTMAEERIPLDLTSAAGHAAAGQLQKQSLRSGNYATPMTPFSPFEGGGGSNSPFARVDSMGVKGDTLPSVSLQGHLWCGLL